MPSSTESLAQVRIRETDFLEFSALAANDLYDGMAHSAGDFA